MNISELITRSGWRVWIVVFTVVIAVGAALFFSLGQPQRYVATASVTVVPPPGTPPTAQVVNQSVENLRSVVDSRGLAQIVSEQTGSSFRAVRDSLSTERIRTGNVVEVVAESNKAAGAVATAEAAALEAVRLQAQAEVAVAEQGVDLAQSRYADADTNLTTFVIELGIADPEAELVRRSAALLEAQVALASPEPDDITTELEKDVADAQQALDELPTDLVRYRTLVLERDAALEGLSDAIGTQLEAQATANVATNVLIVTPEQAMTVSRRQEAAQTAIAAGVVGLLLGLGILAVMEVLPSRVRARRHARAGQPGSDAPPDSA